MTWKSAFKDQTIKCLTISTFIFVLSLIFIVSTEIVGITFPLWLKNVRLSVFVVSGVVAIICLAIIDRRKSRLSKKAKE